jgi:hypothetical protein
MKKLLVTTTLFFVSYGLFSQVTFDPATKSQQESYEYYMRKSKTNKTIGWVLAGTGTALAIGGAIAATKEVTENVLNLDTKLSDTDDILLGAGVACAVASVPFFISAGKNKKRAKIAVGTQPITLGYYRTQSRSYISAGFSFNL